jgi:menaquinone-dependent protoporphyrinogen IX oxidase
MIEQGFIAALLGSRWFLYAIAIFAGAITYEGWKYHERHIGAAKVVAEIREKADGDAKLAETVRANVDAGKRGVRGKYQRADD